MHIILMTRVLILVHTNKNKTKNEYVLYEFVTKQEESRRSFV